MKNKLFKSYLVISLIVLLLITLTSGIYLTSLYKSNSKYAVNSVEKIKSDLTTVFLAEGSFSSDLFKNRVKKAVSDNRRIYSLIISDKDNSIKYLYIKNRNLVKTIPEPVNKSSISFPEYKNTGFSYSVINDSFIIPGKNIHNIEVLYKIISNSEILRIIKITIIFLLLFIIISIIFILYIPSANKTVISVNTVDNTLTSNNEKSTETKTVSADKNSSETLVWEEYLEKKLKYELEKAASFDQDVSFAVISYEKCTTDTKHIKKELIETVSSYFSLDLSFEYGKKGFALIMPDKELEEGITEINAFIARLEELYDIDNIKAGLSSRNSRIISPSILIKEAEGALKKTFSEPDRKLIAFRSDPDKYRNYISSHNFSS